MKIAILDLTTHASPLLDGLPRASAQIVDWLAPAFPEGDFAVTDVAHGAPMPAIAAFDGLLLSGSELGVYDDVAWLAPLRQLLLATRDAGKPIFGICFGHQIMADVFGGKAEKAACGNTVGARAFSAGVKASDAYVWHQDQVTSVPPGAQVTASASYCPVGALAYDFPALSVQFHPEYRLPHLTELFERGRDVFIAGHEVDAALLSIKDSGVSADLMAHEAAGFFRQAPKP